MFTCRPVNVDERKVASIIIGRTRTGNLHILEDKGQTISLLYRIRTGFEAWGSFPGAKVAGA
jgi:hypothetical protein